jgi:hypothetical protein
MLGSSIRVFVEPKLRAKRVGDSRNADPLRSDGDERGGEDGVALFRADSAVKDSRGKSLKHGVSNFVGASKGKRDSEDV